MYKGITHPLAYWQTDSYIPLKNQICRVTDFPAYKIGDGVNTFNNLTFIFTWPSYVWFSSYETEISDTNKLTTFYAPQLLGGSFVQEGGWCDFSLVIIPANNANVKNAYVKFFNNTLLTISIPINNNTPIKITGSIKCIAFKAENCFYELKAEQGNSILTTSYGILSGVDWAINNKLIIQGEGVADGDIVSRSGNGILNIIPRYSNF